MDSSVVKNHSAQDMRFNSILELARLGAVSLFQGVADSGAPAGPIRLRATGGELADDWVNRISELM